jgi:hypothetical protein
MSLTSVEVFDYTIGGTPASVLIESSSGPAIVDLDTNEPSVVLINQGPAGDISDAPISTITTTNLTGYIFGNGTNIAGATAASSSEGSGTLVIRDIDGSFSTTSSNSDSSIIGVNTGNGSGLTGFSQSGAGGLSITTDGNYHHKFGFFNSESGAPAIAAIERLRGWFVWFFSTFTGRLKTADITANREWTLPNVSGFVALTQNANGAVTNTEFYAKAAVPITAGQAVYISGASGANKIITLAQANTEATSSKTIGLALQNLATNGFGYVVSEGDVTGLTINLGSGHGVSEGDPIWLSPITPGGLIFGLANKPSAPNHLVFLGYVTQINGNTLTEIFVKVQNGFELEELHNVAINSVANGQILAYESSTGLWKNKPTATTKATTGNPASGIEGEICINTFDNNVKIYAEGGWRQIASW